MKLTIGMPHYDDYRGVYMTVQSLKLYHDLTDVEILVVDNSPDKKSAIGCKALLDHFKGDFKTRYIPMPECRGPAHAKNEVMKQAAGEVVMVMDCHVMLGKDAVKRLKEYPIDNSFYTGPLLMDDCRTTCTHFDMMWRGGMWGIWAQAWQHPDGTMFSVYHNQDNFLEFFDLTISRKKLSLNLPIIPAKGNWQNSLLLAGCKPIGNNPEDPPFKIPAQGCGLFVVRKDSWLGFNDDFYGFGGEEGYIHAKYASVFRPTICLPFLRWNHFFRKGDAVPYTVNMQDRIRNYAVGFNEVGLSLDPLKREFVPKHMSEEEWVELVKDPVKYARKGLTTPAQSVASFTNFDELQNWAKNHDTKQFPQVYFDALKVHASVSPQVLDISQNSTNLVALGSGSPERIEVVKEVDKVDTATKHMVSDLYPGQVVVTESPSLDREYDLVLIEPSPATHINCKIMLDTIAPRAKRFFAISGITPYQVRGTDGGDGFSQAIRDFCGEHKEWFVSSHIPQGRGLVVLSKNIVDKPEHEIRIWPMKNGPGHFLKQNLKKYLGIESTPNCSCNKRALMMDIQGPEWCKQNIPTIVNWLKEEYDRRRSSSDKTEKLGLVASLLPFSEKAATILVKTSIKQSEKCQ